MILQPPNTGGPGTISGNFLVQRDFQIVWMPAKYGIPAGYETPGSLTMKAFPLERQWKQSLSVPQLGWPPVSVT